MDKRPDDEGLSEAVRLLKAERRCFLESSRVQENQAT